MNLLIFLLIILLIENSVQQFYTIPDDEFNALYDFYYSTNGNYWIWQNESLSGLKWNFSNSFISQNNSSPCYWQGIQCSCLNNSNYHYYRDVYLETAYGTFNYYYDDYDLVITNSSNCNIEKINLLNYNLSGVITNSISKFTYLTHLKVNGNNLYSTVPSSINLLTNLIQLSLSTNQLTGPVPDINALNKVYLLNLGINKFTGSLPDISNLIKLNYVLFNNNKFTSSIPTSIGLLSQLIQIGIYTSIYLSLSLSLTKISYFYININNSFKS
jgi:Leucine-rich repeat (LRR) protein